MGKQKAEDIGKKKKQRPKADYADGNGQDLVQGWGIIHCAECELPIGFYPPDVDIDDGDNLELYCQGCAIALNQVGQ